MNGDITFITIYIRSLNFPSSGLNVKFRFIRLHIECISSAYGRCVVVRVIWCTVALHQCPHVCCSKMDREAGFLV